MDDDLFTYACFLFAVAFATTGGLMAYWHDVHEPRRATASATTDDAIEMRVMGSNDYRSVPDVEWAASDEVV